MCGRFANAVGSNQLVPHVQRHYPDLPLAGWANEADREQWRPRYNITPSSNVPVIRREGGQNVVRVMNWSIVPHWTKHQQSYGDRLKTINARSETLTGAEDTSKLWMSLAPSKRCIVPVQGFYEWLDKGKGSAGKAPHYIRSPAPSDGSSPTAGSSGAQQTDGQNDDVPPLMLAGLWDSVTYEETDTALLTFTILTTASSKPLRFLHTRMPCILRTEQEMQAWLDCEPVKPSQAAAAAKEGRNKWTKELGALLKPTDVVTCYAVPQEVNKVGNDSASFVHPVAQRKDGIDSLFKKAFAKGAQPLAGPGPASAAATKRAKSSSPEKALGGGGGSKAGPAKASKPRVKGGKRPKAEGSGDEAQVVVLSDEDDEVVAVGSPPPGQRPSSPILVGSSPAPEEKHTPRKKSDSRGPSSGGRASGGVKRKVDEEEDEREAKRGKVSE